jgi:hypothetical protein
VKWQLYAVGHGGNGSDIRASRLGRKYKGLDKSEVVTRQSWMSWISLSLPGRDMIIPPKDIYVSNHGGWIAGVWRCAEEILT